MANSYSKPTGANSYSKPTGANSYSKPTGANSYSTYNDFESGIKRSPATLTPRIINTFFLLALQRYFTQHPEYHWDPDVNKTEIDVHVDFEEDDNVEKGLPVVVVQGGPVSISPAGIGTGMYTMNPRVVKRGGKTMLQDAFLDSQLQFEVNSNISITIVGMSVDDVNELAFEIAMFLMMVKYDAAKILQIQNLGTAQISPAQASDRKGWTNRYTSQVMLPYTFTLTRIWNPVDSGELLKEIPTIIDTIVSGIKHKEKFKPLNTVVQPGDKQIENI